MSAPEGGSLNYALVGNRIPLQGLTRAQDYYGFADDGADPFIQHHASTYRRLLEMMYGLAATTEVPPELAPPPPRMTTPAIP